jgi:hypothetical protein
MDKNMSQPVPVRRSIFGFPLESMMMEYGVPDLVTISPETTSFSSWRNVRRGSLSSECSGDDSKGDELEDLSVVQLDGVDQQENAPLPIKPCLRTEDTAKEVNPRRRTWFDLRPPNVRVVSGDSGWWQPEDFKLFRDRLLKDDCLPDMQMRKRVNR